MAVWSDVQQGRFVMTASPERCKGTVALKSIYPLLSLHCTRISSCGCAERWWAILKVCRVGRLT